MSNLFIIGNGFDISHGLPTAYENFRKFLFDKYEIDEEELEDFTVIPEGGFYNDQTDEIEYDDYEIALFFSRLMFEIEGKDWSQFEENLAHLDMKSCIENQILPGFTLSEEMNICEGLARFIADNLSRINKYFKDWIKSIKIGNDTQKKLSFEKLLTKEDLFLNFNYTRTLKEIYAVDNVCHIHGEVQVKEELIFGHGEEWEYNLAYNLKYIEAESILIQAFNCLKKRTEETLKSKINFFNKINKKVKKIYSYGFSYSSVDLIYIREICENLDSKNIIWHLNTYDDKEEKNKAFEKCIRKCGFEGEFKKYSIND